mgnify:CR=1 FL=1
MNTAVDDIFKNAPMEKSDIRKTYLTLKELISKFENPKKFKISHRSAIKQELTSLLEKAATFFEKDSPQLNMISDLKKIIESNGIEIYSKCNIDGCGNILKYYCCEEKTSKLSSL